MIVFSCKTEKTEQPQKKITQNKDTTHINQKDITKIEEYAKFISGLKTEKYSVFQKKNIYKKYANSNSTNWNYFSKNQINGIRTWIANNNITSETDTTTLFYPFSGPDFTFAFSFFPYAKNYVLIGLENIGNIPELNDYTDLEIKNLLTSISKSMIEFYKNGYFSTVNMKNNFRKSNMNGVIHPLLYFIYKTNNTLTNYEYFVVDKCGILQPVEFHQPLDKRIKGIKLSFTGEYGEKTLYYLQTDLSDKNYKDYPELVAFISSFKNKNCFLKSASYLLQDFILLNFRDLLISQSNKIVQDDSGFSLEFLKKNNFNVKVFGKYSGTLNIFKEYKQNDLIEEFKKQKAEKLPFRFGYNVAFDKTAIIFAQKQQPPDIKYPVFKVQLQMSWEKLTKADFPESFESLDYYYDEGYYKYTLGNFTNKEECEKLLENVKKMGYNDAFIIKFTEKSRENFEN